MPAPNTYWHGGAPGLQVGKALLPPCLSGVRPTSLLLQAAGMDLAPRADRVYLFAARELAEVWAGLYGLGLEIGWVYEVRPEGALEPDSDPYLKPGASWQCSRARILAAHPLGVQGLKRVRDDVRASLRLKTGGAS